MVCTKVNQFCSLATVKKDGCYCNLTNCIISNIEVGHKHDTGKDRWDLVQWDIITETVKVLTYGANKYGAGNWKSVEQSRYVAALFRHIIAFLNGEEKDSETELSHLAHAMCNLMFIYELDKCE